MDQGMGEQVGICSVPTTGTASWDRSSQLRGSVLFLQLPGLEQDTVGTLAPMERAYSPASPARPGPLVTAFGIHLRPSPEGRAVLAVQAAVGGSGVSIREKGFGAFFSFCWD